MPFKSQKQKGFMWANEPEIAKKWSDKYGSQPIKTKKPKQAKAPKANAAKRLMIKKGSM